ncbi:ORF051 putative membrane protein [Bovine papular stomatitis virus]|uniref:ORF051 putative membrane protein n=1 Tax=Bovine papular stomatitis virus TaxID=129727 RepID=Q6TVD7_9POXV|nr:ORF051 putative membrane protein [Bovine papular stomatitis virus]AAR98408.1 ORF051 putative membrane protein [Bovine papular stomatitis virus]
MATDKAAPVVNLTPVFVEPTIAHSLLRSEPYLTLVVLELLLALALTYLFFGDELRSALRGRQRPPSPLDAYGEASLACDGDALMIELPGGRLPALALDGRPVAFPGCDGVLRRINGTRKVRLVDVLGRG